MHVDGELVSVAEYLDHGHGLVFNHTVTIPRFRGRGYADQLVAAAREAGVDVAAGRVEGPSFGVIDEQVVDGDVEDLGHADDGLESGGDLGVLVAGDLPGVGVDLLGQLGLGPAGFGVA